MGDTIQTSFEERQSTSEERGFLLSSQYEQELRIGTEFPPASHEPAYVDAQQAPHSLPTPLPKDDVSSAALEAQEVSPSTSPTREDLSDTVHHSTDALIREQPIAYTEPAVFSPRSEVTIEVQVPSSRSSSTSQDTVHELPAPAPSAISAEPPVSSSRTEESLPSPVGVTSSITEETVNDTLPSFASTFREEQWTSSPQLRTLSLTPSENTITSTSLIADEVTPSLSPASSVTASAVQEDAKADSTVSTTSISTDQMNFSFDPRSPNLSSEAGKLPTIPTAEASSFSSPGETSKAGQPASFDRQISSTSSPPSRTSSISAEKVTEVEGSPPSTLTTATPVEPQKPTEITFTASSIADSSSEASELVAQSTSPVDNEHQIGTSSVTENSPPASGGFNSEMPLTSTSAEHAASTERDPTEQMPGGDLFGHSLESSIVEELEISFDTKPSQSRSSSAYDLSSPLLGQRERVESGESDTRLSSSKDDQGTFRIDEAINSTKREEEEEGESSHSPSLNQSEETRPTDILSSIVIKEYPSSDDPSEPRPSPVPDSGQQSSHDSSLTDVEGQSLRSRTPTETTWWIIPCSTLLFIHFRNDRTDLLQSGQ